MQGMNYNNFFARRFNVTLPQWSIYCPLAGLIILAFSGKHQPLFLTIIMAISLISVVLSAVHHAEVIAHKVGEPFGTLLLALAITIIEVSLIVSIMLTESVPVSTLARDTVFAAIMLILTGIIGFCLLLGGYRFKEQLFTKQGVSAALVTLTAISMLTLVLPNYTTSVPGPVYSKSQLLFIAIVSLVLYGGFVSVQTLRHRDYFLPTEGTPEDEEIHVDPPNNITAIASLLLLLVALIAVVMESKKLSPTLESLLMNLGAPKSFVGVVIAGVILMPEGLAAIRAARKNRLQTSLNLALGSALASIGLTIPAVAIVTLFAGFNVAMGINTKSMLLLVLSLFTISISFNAGKTNIQQGVVLLVILATYLFTTIVP